MKKCSICLMMMALFFALAACGQQNREKEDLRDVIAHRTYLYEKEGFGGEFTIQINDDGTFIYYEGALSSYIGIGSWVLDDDILVLSEGDGDAFVNRFKVDGSDLVFLSEGSSNFMYVKVVDGERFTGTSDEAYELIFRRHEM